MPLSDNSIAVSSGSSSSINNNNNNKFLKHGVHKVLWNGIKL